MSARLFRSAVFCFLFASQSVSAGISVSPSEGESRWLDADGKPLPFRDDAELLEFLRTASVVSEREIGIGINASRKLLLERNGVRAHAIFREVDRREVMARVQGTTYRFFADSYLFEPAAYELGVMLGLHTVPPAVVRTVARRKGSAQIWVEDVIDEQGIDFRPPSAIAWAQQVWDMTFFDNLVYNTDRNEGNVVVSANYQLWMIDHTRAFQVKDDLLNDDVIKMRRRTWELLLTLDEEVLRAQLSKYLTSNETRSLWERRERIIQHIHRLVNERGEKVVFFE